MLLEEVFLSEPCVNAIGAAISSCAESSSEARSRLVLESHRLHAQEIHRRFVDHLLDDAPLLPSWARHVEQLSTHRSSFLVVPRSRPEDAYCMDLGRFSTVAKRLRPWVSLADVRLEPALIERRASDLVFIRAASTIFAGSRGESAQVLTLRAEWALASRKPRRLSLTLCYDESCGTMPLALSS